MFFFIHLELRSTSIIPLYPITANPACAPNDPLINLYTKQFLETFNAYPVMKPANVRNWSNYWTLMDTISGKIKPVKNTRDGWLLYSGILAAHSSYFEKEKKWRTILGDVIK